jgi:hypothetical protein
MSASSAGTSDSNAGCALAIACHERRAHVPVRVRRRPGHHLEQARSEQVDVRRRPLRRAVPERQLRRHVRGRPRGAAHVAHVQDAVVLARPPIQPHRDPPVDDEHLPVVADHHVRGLQIPVQEPLRVREGHRVAHRQEDLQVPPEVPRRPVLAQQIEPRAPLHELHREHRPPVRRATERVHGDDVGVRQPGRDARLGEEVLHRGRVVRRELLERHLAPQRALHGPPHLAHPPAPDRRHHVVRLRHARRRQRLLRARHVLHEERRVLRRRRPSPRRRTSSGAAPPPSRSPAPPRACT